MKTVLLVDDSPSVRTLLRMALEREGYQVLDAEDGEAAIGALDGRPLSAIVSDISMPRMDGMSFMRYLRMHPRYKFTPVLVLSTDTRPEMRQAARDHGANAFLTKPCTPSQLVDAVARLSV
jgi:two-component system, chemotaxis family, chemotaxis protein CheY